MQSKQQSFTVISIADSCEVYFPQNMSSEIPPGVTLLSTLFFLFL